MSQFFIKIFLTSILTGIVCGIVSVWVVLLNIPFISVTMSHAAFAGAIFGVLSNINPLFSSVIFCLIASILLGPIAERAEFSVNISTSVIFSFVLGIAFILAGLIKGSKAEVLSYIWGNILNVSWNSVLFLAIVLFIIVLFTILFYKEILAVLFNREIAKSVGIYEKFIFLSLIFLCGITVAVTLNYIGGLLIFGLITLPGLSSYQLTYDLNKMYVVSVVFAVLSSLVGLLTSYFLNLPIAATTIVISNIIFIFCVLLSPKKL